TPPNLPWLAYRHDEATCNVRPTDRREDRAYTSGCYLVPSTEQDAVIWDVTQTMHQTGSWQLIGEVLVEPDDADPFALELWRDVLLPDWQVTIRYPLDGDARFVVELSYPMLGDD